MGIRRNYNQSCEKNGTASFSNFVCKTSRGLKARVWITPNEPSEATAKLGVFVLLHT